ncbi:MAG: hypothetical protein U5K84_00075 [Alkalibacterium sp.]|nr:hypothetical protein [Alkalibacterium sp.]
MQSEGYESAGETGGQIGTETMPQTSLFLGREDGGKVNLIASLNNKAIDKGLKAGHLIEGRLTLR